MAQTWAQRTPGWLGPNDRIFRGVTVRNLQQAETSGRIEIRAEIPIAANQLLAEHLKVSRIDDPARWSVLVIRKGRYVGLLGVRAVEAQPTPGPYRQVTLQAAVPVEYSSKDTKFYFAVLGRDTELDYDLRIVFGDASLTATHTPRTLRSVSIQPALANVEGADKQWVLELPVRIGFPRPFGGDPLHPIHASFAATLSTQLNDTNAGFTGTVSQETTDVYRRSILLPFMRREWGVRYRSNESLTNRKTGVYYSFEVPVTGRPIDTGGRYRTQSPALLKLGLLSAEYRERIDTGINPHHTATFLANPWLQLTMPPLYFSGGDRPSPYRDPYLTLSTKAWYFPWEEAKGGFAVRRFESRFDAELTWPFRGLLGQALVLGFHTGANENDNYARQSSFTLEFRLFGRKTSLYRTGQ
ncbi:hypothetical protein OP10G_1595 [Fimbriimonas ginsengisoli Gsoil 348]|uniref:Uncharacterized protein n=1 Tax=Fimbriimonas ginsengisoli Gsoil 348 TaxID=661478 RepID=A0A068NN27_FIMGI|nr:hypothetical protein OP10G_1595 [Fimbriimonas ginsengisoli Gsoil 348]